MTVEASGSRMGLLAGLLGGIVVLAVGLVLMALNLPGGTTLAGRSIGSVEDAPTALGHAAGSLQALPITLTTPTGSQTTVVGGRIGLDVDVEASLTPVQQGWPSIRAWAKRLPGGPLQAPLVIEPLDPEALEDIAAEASVDPVNAELDVRRAGIDTIPGQDGVTVTGEQVAEAIDRAIASIATIDPDRWPQPVEVEVDGTVVPPPVGQADIDAIGEVVQRLESATVEVTAEVVLPDAEGDGDEGEVEQDRESVAQTLTLTPNELRTLVDVEAVPDAPEGQRLRLVPNPEGTPARLVALMDLARVPPELNAHIENRSPTPSRGEDASDVSTVTGDVVLDDVVPGFEPDREATLSQVIDAALAGGGQVSIVGDEDAEADPAEAGIREPVSTFTTYFQSGQSRVTNIRRIAEIVDGAIIPSGESFEVNHYVGRRTRENGFVGGGAILDGELVSDVGGGVSQFATTFFNAAWFAGIELVDYKAHSIYIPRYPPGREATINYPNVNLEVRNDTPYDILVDTDSTPSSVTVTFWSTPYWDVQTVMGPCACGGAFTITNQRILTAPGGQPVTEEYTTRYTVLRN